MSQAPHEATNVPNAGFDTANVGDYQYPPQPPQNQGSHGVSNFVDGSGPIFSMYMEMATEEDKKMAENWKADADGILIFTGLFSAAVASLISVSIQDIRPNPQDTSNFYLANIYQTIADPNRSNISSSLPASPPPFSPPNYAVWVNSLWFMSLVISLTCALLATLLQQWARRYLKVTQSRYSPHKRARIRAFFAEGVEKLLLPWVVETLPALLHISLFLFFAGLVVFLCNVNITIFKLALSWVGVCTALYGCITFMPIFRLDSPYFTSLSSSVWLIVLGIRRIVSEVRFRYYLVVHSPRLVFRRFGYSTRYYRWFLQGMQRTAEETALNSQSEIDTRAFMWTFDCLDEDHELERFFSALPGFRSSKVVNDPLPSLTKEQKWKLLDALIGLSDRTFSSDLLPKSIKNRRAVICARAIDPADIPEAFPHVLDRIVDEWLDGPVRSSGIARLIRGWGNSKGEYSPTEISAIVSGVVAKAQRRDGYWFAIASEELGIPETVLRDYAAHGDSLSLSILIHITRQQLSLLGKTSWPRKKFSKVLEAASKFNVQETSPLLQHEFCALWNQIVLHAQNVDYNWMAYQILLPIRNVYIDLHQGTDSAPARFSASTADHDPVLFWASSYPECNVAGHIHDNSASTTFSRASPHDNVVLAPPSLSSPDPPSSSAPAQHHVDETLVDVPQLDNNICFPRPFHPAYQTNIGSLRIPVSSLGPATASAIQDIVTSDITILHPTPETSKSAPSSTPPAAVTLQHNPDLLTSSDPPNLPSSSSSNPALDNTLPTGTTAPSASPRPTSAPDLGAAAEGDGSPQPGSHKEKDALGLPSVNRAIHANTTATLDLPPQSPSLRPITDSDAAVVGPSPWEPNTELTGDQRSSSACFASPV